MVFLIETKQTEKNTHLYIFSRDKDGKKHMSIEKKFRPYFYVDADVVIPDDYRITDVETGHINLLNEPVKKVFIQRSKDVVSVRSLFKKHYEADILFTQRYIIDVIGEAEIYKLHTLSIDIETDSIDTFPNIDEPDQAIIACAFKDNKGFKRKYLYKSEETVVEIEEDENTRIFRTENQLLEAIVALIKQIDPDIITGWYVIDFDLAYLLNRMKQRYIKYSAMSPLDMVFCNRDSRKDYSDKWDIKIAGRIILDGLDLYRHFRKISNQGRAEKYTLEFTAQTVLGIGKLPHKENFHDMWVNKPNELMEYNFRDAELVIDILEKLEIIDFFNYLRSKSMAQLSQIYQATSLVDGLLLREVHNKYVLPSKDKQNTDRYKGAHVFPPKPGLYEKVIALDLKALYPNIIKTFNVGYETFNPDGEIKLDDDIGFDRGIGIMSKIMRELEKERNIYKKRKWNADKMDNNDDYKLNHYRESSIKVLMNSFYGYLGYPGSRLYKKEVAEAITRWGVSILKWSWAVLKNLGYDVIYGDTDSVYVKAKESSIFKLLIEGKELIKHLNKSYIKFTRNYGSDDCTLEIEFEKIFKKVLFVSKKGSDENEGAKKKYAYILLWEDNKKVDDSVHFTGFETVRSDTPRIARTTQTEIVEKLLRGVTKEEITTQLEQLDADIRSKEIPTEDIAFPKGISKHLHEYGKIKEDEVTKVKTRISIPPVIKGAEYANKYLGKRFGRGSKPKWLYIKKTPYGYPNTKVLSFDEEEIPEGFVIDYDTMIDKILKMKLEKIMIAGGFGEFPKTDTRQRTI